MSKSYYAGTCRDFNGEGTCTNSTLPYRDVSDFARHEENAHQISRNEFETNTTIPSPLQKLHDRKSTIYLHDKENNVHMMYDPNKDIHHFFVKEDAGPTNVAGGGQVAGLGVKNPNVPNQDEPGGMYPRKKPLRRIIPKGLLLGDKEE